MVSLSKIVKGGKAMFLAYDQGFEHGPVEFNDENVDPLFIIDLAKKGGFTGFVFHKGIAEKYRKEIKKSKVSLIVKLNGKTNLFKGESVSLQECSVKEALKLGASAVGYTVYLGSEFENKMLEEWGAIVREAHNAGIPAILWAYPRGKNVSKKDPKAMAYAARIGLETGADIVKIGYFGSSRDLRWAVNSAGRCKVVIAGGTKTGKEEFIKDVKDIIKAGGIGIAVGRNAWQAKDPLEIANKMKKVIW